MASSISTKTEESAKEGDKDLSSSVRIVEEEVMPKDGKKGKKRDCFIQQTSDLTLQQFADSAKPHACSRVKKSFVGASAPAAAISKNRSGQTFVEKKKEEEELDWFDKDLEDFDIEDKLDTDEEEEDLSKISIEKKDKKKKKCTKDDEDFGINWPIDLWDILADYIDPADIGRFALLCKSTHAITLLAGFWRRLYNRYYILGSDGLPPRLPDHLGPHSVERLHGLKARVIRSMFLLHPRLQGRVANKGPMDDQPHSLRGQRCLLAWHQPAPRRWQFCFKFHKLSLHSLRSRPVSKDDVYEGYNDLLYNPDSGCSVLQVSTTHFAAVPPVMGLLLNQVYLTLSANLRHHRLRLHFDSRPDSKHNSVSDFVVVIDDVTAIKVMPWWHPQYPFTS